MSKEVNQEERSPRTVADVKEMLTKHSNGEIQRTIQNCITILQNDHVLADAIRLNLLSERIDIVKPVNLSLMSTLPTLTITAAMSSPSSSMRMPTKQPFKSWAVSSIFSRLSCTPMKSTAP